MWAGSATNTCLGHHEIANGVHGDPAWGLDSNRHGFMTYILCCPAGASDKALVLPPIFTGDWMQGQDSSTDGYGSWGAAVDWCVAQGRCLGQ